MFNRLNPFKPKIYEHTIVITYHSGSMRTKYKGMDEETAKKTFNEYKVKRNKSITTNILFGTWYRDGEQYQTF